MADRVVREKGCRGPLQKITCRSAKCDICELKQRSKIYRCPDCAKQICEQCMSSPKASHRLAPPVETDGPSTSHSKVTPVGTLDIQQLAPMKSETEIKPLQKQPGDSSENEKVTAKIPVEYLLAEHPLKRAYGESSFSNQVPRAVILAYQSCDGPFSTDKTIRETSALQISRSTDGLMVDKKAKLGTPTVLRLGIRAIKQAEQRTPVSQKDPISAVLGHKQGQDTRTLGRMSLRLPGAGSQGEVRQQQVYWPYWPKRSKTQDDHQKVDDNEPRANYNKPKESGQVVNRIQGYVAGTENIANANFQSHGDAKRPLEKQPASFSKDVPDSRVTGMGPVASATRGVNSIRETYPAATLPISKSSNAAVVERSTQGSKRLFGDPGSDSVKKPRHAEEAPNSSTIAKPDKDGDGTAAVEQKAVQQPFVSKQTEELFKSGSRYKWDGYGIDLLLAASKELE